MNIALVTGSGGLIGSEAVAFFAARFDLVIGVDNNMRQYFFGKDGSVNWNIERLKTNYDNYEHHDIDIRKLNNLQSLFTKYKSDIKL
ncbi:MAG: CDP-paratose 2-epimerase, partial [Cyclobacteriaceae bacterium]